MSRRSDAQKQTIHATDPGAGGGVVQWFVRWEEGGDFIEHADSACNTDSINTALGE